MLGMGLMGHDLCYEMGLYMSSITIHNTKSDQRPGAPEHSVSTLPPLSSLSTKIFCCENGGPEGPLRMSLLGITTGKARYRILVVAYKFSSQLLLSVSI